MEENDAAWVWGGLPFEIALLVAAESKVLLLSLLAVELLVAVLPSTELEANDPSTELVVELPTVVWLSTELLVTITRIELRVIG